MRSIGFPELLVILAVPLVAVIPACLICKKVGYSPWWGILVVFPVANVVGLWYLGLAEWPTLRRGRIISTGNSTP
jgi:hypothetical protein